MGFLGYLILLPLGLLFWIAVKAINYSVQGGSKRLVGILACPILGGLCMLLGWWMAFVGYLDYRPDGVYQVTWPIAGWIGIVGGGLYILGGTLWSAFGHEKWEDENNNLENKRKEKMYRQWVEQARLISDTVPPKADRPKDVPFQVDGSEAISSEDNESLRTHIEPDSSLVTHPQVTLDMMAEINRKQLRRRILYILLGVSLVIFCAGLTLLVVLSC